MGALKGIFGNQKNRLYLELVGILILGASYVGLDYRAKVIQKNNHNKHVDGLLEIFKDDFRTTCEASPVTFENGYPEVVSGGRLPAIVKRRDETRREQSCEERVIIMLKEEKSKWVCVPGITRGYFSPGKKLYEPDELNMNHAKFKDIPCIGRKKYLFFFSY